MQPQSTLSTSVPEEWRAVPGWEGWYSVSSHGRVRRDAGGRGSHRGRIVTAKNLTKGYKGVSLYRHNQEHRYSIHRLVARAFLGEPPEGHEVDHRDGVPGHNHVSNLHYVSHADNIRLARERAVAQTRKPHPVAVLTIDEVLAIRSSDEDERTLAARYHVAVRTIRRIANGQRWQSADGPRRPVGKTGIYSRKPSLPVEAIRAIRASSLSNVKLAKMYGTSHSTVAAIKAGRVWADVL